MKQQHPSSLIVETGIEGSGCGFRTIVIALCSTTPSRRPREVSSPDRSCIIIIIIIILGTLETIIIKLPSTIAIILKWVRCTKL